MHGIPARGWFHLALEDSRTGVGVGSWDRPVDVDEEAWVVGLIGTREGNQGASCLASASGDIDLTARKVDLGTTCAAGAVQSDMLNSQKVLPGWNAAWDGDGDGGLTYTLHVRKNGIPLFPYLLSSSGLGAYQMAS